MNDVRMVAIDDVVVPHRHRKDMGDLNTLVESIKKVGLLHPVVVRTDLRLLAGGRRLEACRMLGWREIAATVVSSMEDAYALLVERDENTVREEMRISEKVALGLELEELERPKAAERKAAKQAKPGEQIGAVNFTAPNGRNGETRDIVGATVGMSGITYQRAKAVVQAAEDETLTEAVRSVAREAVKQMDETGKVLGAFETVADATGRHRKPRENDKPYTVETNRQRELANGQKRRIVDALSGISGFCKGLKDVKVSMACAVLSEDERLDWARMAFASAKEIRAFGQSLKNVVAE